MSTLSERIYNAIDNTGPRTNNARALADEVEVLEAELKDAYGLLEAAKRHALQPAPPRIRR